MKKLLSVTGFTALLTLLRMCTGFIIAKVVAVYTGPTGLAMLGQVQSVVGILNGVVNSPAGVGVVRYTAENIDNGFDACAPWWRAAFQWITGLMLLIIPIGLLLSKPLSIWLFENIEYYWIIIVACCTLPFAGANTLIASVINGQQKYKRYVVIGMASNVISTTVMITLIYFYSLKGALIAAAVSAGINGVVMILLSLRQPWFKCKYWWGIVEQENRKKIGSYVLMAITSALMIPMSLIFVRMILASLLGWDSVGQWQAIWKVSEVYLSVITIGLSVYYLPKLSKLKTIESIRSEINKTAIIIIPILVVLSFTIYIFRDEIVLLLFTDEFHAVRELFAIQLVGDVIKILSWLYAYPMLSKGATKWFISSEVLFSLNFVAFVWFLVPYFGIKGVCAAYLINYFCYLIFAVVNLPKFAR